MKVRLKTNPSRPWTDQLASGFQWLLIVVGVVSLLAFAWLKYEEYHGQASLERQFEELSSARRSSPGRLQFIPPSDDRSSHARDRRLEGLDETRSAASTPSSKRSGENALRKSPPTERSYPGARIVGRLTSDRIGLRVVVLDGADRATLRRAAGRVPEGATAEEVGNLVIAAHRDTYFRPLERIDDGDEIVLETPAGKRFVYEVTWVAVVDPSNIQPLDPTPHRALTLVTCYPFEYVGTAPRRFIVRAIEKFSVDS